MSRLFVLVDCSNFYCSCERLFRPDLERVPIAVLSNNDGCVVARSEEVKALGIPMGAPFFKVREKLEAGGAVVFSSNYELVCSTERPPSTPGAPGATGGDACTTRAAT